MVEVFKLLHLVSDSSNNFSKTPVIHVVLFIVITWLVVDKSTPKPHFSFNPKKKKNDKDLKECTFDMYIGNNGVW